MAFTTAILLHCTMANTVLAQQQEIPESKRTTLGLYLTAKEAYEK